MTSVLVFSRDSEWFGGVVNFIALLEQYFKDDIKCKLFRIGRRKSRGMWLLRPFIPILDALRLLLLLFRHRFDAHHLNPSFNYSSLARDGLYMLVLRLMRAKNVIVSFHGWSESVEQRISRYRLLGFLIRYVFGYADHTLVLSDDFRRGLIKIGFDGDRVRVFTTMFNSAEFADVRAKGQRDESRVLFLSRLVREKGLYELLEAFRLLTAEYPELKLVIAGTGPEESKMMRYVCENGIQERVEFLGYVRGPDKVKAFAEAGMFVFPTYYGEGCPVSLLEAMAAGLPVITTAVGGIPHIVQDSVNGILLNRVSVETVEKAMRRLLDDVDLCRKMGARNAEDAWSKYSAHTVTRMFERLYSGQGV